MVDRQSSERADGAWVGYGRADMLASEALARVASRSAAARPRTRTEFVDLLIRAALAPDSGARTRLMSEFAAAGIRSTEIVDHYIPLAARKLGAGWSEDVTSFAEVTIGTSRLQAMVREVEDTRARPMPADTASILVVVGQECFHTLGALIVTAQLRRMGFSVRLSLGHSDVEVTAMLCDMPFDAVLLSASRSERLDLIGRMVDNIRAAVVPAPPIVLGGTILDQEIDVKSLTGVDHTSKDPKEALDMCGLKVPTRDVAPRALKGG